MKRTSIAFLSFILILFQPSIVVTAEVNGAELHFIDVGQADSILVLQENKAMLIDAGDNKDGEKVSSYLKSLGIKRLDYLIATHPHHDHIGGMDQVVNEFEIGKIIMPDVSYPTRHYRSLMKAIKKKDIHVTIAESGKKARFGKEITLHFLSPLRHAEYEDFNDYSAVVQLKHRNNTFLLMGDAGEQAEKEILADAKKSLASDVIKIGHHGADSASNKLFIQAVAPQAAVISVGKNNPYHYPDKSVLKTLSTMKIPIFRTDQLGTVIAKSDGDKIVFHTDAAKQK
ncbi:ComEC/Rec2 family competence protein [Alkalihalobacillus sp. R86527]|uniref:ComEC/Rec2 family competence protein n=1 Tax=Alkalihalobacillus sp. R86527 TaxID=3093863 RepID=UPI00366C0FF8